MNIRAFVLISVLLVIIAILYAKGVKEPYTAADVGLKTVTELDKPQQGKASALIVGGRVDDVRRFPWFVQIKGDSFVCGGALIATEYVLTAAHCLVGKAPQQMFCISGGKQLRAIDMRTNPKYDIALIKIQPSTAQPIDLYTNLVLPTGIHLLAMGRGAITFEDKPRTYTWTEINARPFKTAVMKTVANDTCGTRDLGPGKVQCLKYVTGAFNSGDSGGPVVGTLKSRFVLVGIVSSYVVGTTAKDSHYLIAPVSGNFQWIIESMIIMNKRKRATNVLPGKSFTKPGSAP